MYMELKRRLQSVGVRTIYCWGDEESEGFWLKQASILDPDDQTYVYVDSVNFFWIILSPYLYSQ